MKNRTIGDLSSRWLRRRPENLSESEARVLQSSIDQLAIAENQVEAAEKDDRFAERLSDGIARIGGSWSFILSFIIFLAIWTFANSVILGRDTFDPYPFVFLNLVLSMVAALQAPVIMMSQNRQAERDRAAARQDYEINLKAEIEIMALHEKVVALHEKLELIRSTEVAEIREEIRLLTRAITNGKA